MKFFELARCLEPAVPRGLSRAPYMRELISMYTTVSEAEWATRKDPAHLPADAVLESVASRDSAFSKKVAKAICARLDTQLFVNVLTGLNLATQELIAQNIGDYDEHVDLADFAYRITELLVEILHTETGLKNKSWQLLRQPRIDSAKAKHETQLILRSRGCGKCGTPQAITSHDASRDSFAIIFLDATDPIGLDDFAVTCKQCAEKYNLSLTDEVPSQLRDHNAVFATNEIIDARLAPLWLDSKIIELLTVINQLPIDEATADVSHYVMPLKSTLDVVALMHTCRDAIATYDPIVLSSVKALEQRGELVFEQMRHQIRSAWFVMRNGGMPQYAIWCRLTDWIDEQTHIDTYAGGIVVAFMIQIRDLFTPAEGVPA